MKIPTGYESVILDRARAFARPRAKDWVASTLRSGATLHEAASESTGVEPLEGRGPVPIVSVDGARWAVRHYYRGGAVASLLGDRYLRLGETRPWAEAHWAEIVARRGVPTPEVVAGAVYPAGPFYRADLVTEFIPDSRDLGRALFGDPDPDFPREEALEAAGLLVVEAAEAGVYHPDLNAKNVLLRQTAEALGPYLLDLDRCQVDVAGIGWIENAMRARLTRSLRKLGAGSGRPLSDDDWRAFDAGLNAGVAPSGA